MLTITPTLALDESEIEEKFVRSSGPGGQNVNKVATAVQLRFDIGRSSLPYAVQERLARLAGKRLTAEGVLLIEASEFRTQEQNREAARGRLIALIRKAAERPKPRRPTRPTLASQERRLADKRGRSQTKQRRRDKPDAGE
ncbi:MAG: aminoacyl-tRNA hydrolase [Chloroflexi bacterium]|nr:aminoacyl-tRNA hydrolase [Chloroflexota bacterium]